MNASAVLPRAGCWMDCVWLGQGSISSLAGAGRQWKARLEKAGTKAKSRQTTSSSSPHTEVLPWMISLGFALLIKQSNSVLLFGSKPKRTSHFYFNLLP